MLVNDEKVMHFTAIRENAVKPGLDPLVNEDFAELVRIRHRDLPFMPMLWSGMMPQPKTLFRIPLSPHTIHSNPSEMTSHLDHLRAPRKKQFLCSQLDHIAYFS